VNKTSYRGATDLQNGDIITGNFGSVFLKLKIKATIRVPLFVKSKRHFRHFPKK